MFSDFFQKLVSECASEQVTIRRWSHAHRHTRGVLELTRGKNTLLLYVKESNKSPGFWGLNLNQLTRLIDQQSRWYIILLGATNDNAYLASPADAVERLGPIWKQATKDKDFKVHETAELIGIPKVGHADLIKFLLYEVSHASVGDRTRHHRTFAGQTVAEFMCRLPGKTSRVMRFSSRKPEPHDLVIAMFGYVFGGNHALQRTVMAAAPVLGKFLERLSLEESLVVRVLWERGGTPADEGQILSAINDLLKEREEPTLGSSEIRMVLEKLEKNEVVVRLLTPPARWRLAEPVV